MGPPTPLDFQCRCPASSRSYEGDEGHEGKVSRIGKCGGTDVTGPVKACTEPGKCISTAACSESYDRRAIFHVRTMGHLLRRCASWYIFPHRTFIATTHASK